MNIKSDTLWGTQYSLGEDNIFARMLPYIVLLMAALSSFVFIEPAPVDLLMIMFTGLMFLAGLRIPKGFYLPLVFLMIFLLGNLLSASFVEEPGYSMLYTAVTAYLVLGLIFHVAVMYYDYPRLMRYFWRGYLLAALIAISTGILGFFQLVPGSDLFLAYGRVDGTFKDPNVYGPFLIPIILYLVNRLEEYHGKKQLLILGLVGFLVFGLFMSFSRGAIANLLVSGLVMLVIKLKLYNSYKKFSSYVAIGGIAFILLVLALGVVVTSTDKIQSLFEERAKVLQDYDVEDGGRFSKQRLAIQLSLSNPIGIGPGMGEEVMGLVPHNVYLLVLVENGIIGFIGWTGFFLYTLFYAHRFLRRQTLIPSDFLPVYATIIGTVLESFIIDSIHWRHFYVLFGVLWGIMLAAEKLQEQWVARVGDDSFAQGASGIG